MTVTEQQLEFILTQCPQEFRGRDNWLGYKMSPHSPMVFINKVTTDGVTTNSGFTPWMEVSTETIQTIYQRLKGMQCTKQ